MHCSSTPRQNRHHNAITIEAVTAGDPWSLEVTELIPTEAEGPGEDDMAGVARTCAIARLVVLKVDEVPRVETTMAIEAQEVSGTVEALTMAIRAVVTRRTVRVEPVLVHVIPCNGHMS